MRDRKIFWTYPTSFNYLTSCFFDARESPPLSILIILDGPDPGVHGDAGPEAAAGEWLVGLAAWGTSSSFMCSHPEYFTCIYGCAPHTCAWCLWRPEEDGIGFPRAGITDGCVNEKSPMEGVWLEQRTPGAVCV